MTTGCMDNIKQAVSIASANLRSCYGKNGIFAGSRHFKDYWSWDSYYAGLGSLAIGDHDIVKKNLSLNLDCMRPDGQLPLRVGATTFGIIMAYFGIVQKNKKPVYCIDKSRHPPVTQNSLFLVAAHEYIRETKDIAFLKENLQKFEKIVLWNFSNDIDNDLLIEEKRYCNWADSIKKEGKVLYTNVCHCYSLKCLSALFRIAGDRKKELIYSDLHKKIKAKINELFWTGEHYLDWINEGKQYNYFSTDGNMLAVLWDIADKVRSKHIEEASKIFDINETPSACVHPPYPKNPWPLNCA